MPKIEQCSRCGKQVLTSRYEWSEWMILCSNCAQLSSDETDKIKHDKNLDDATLNTIGFNHASKAVLNKALKKNQLRLSQQEILITWPALIKIFIWLLLMVSLGVVGFRALRMEKQDPSFENIQLSEPELIID